MLVQQLHTRDPSTSFSHCEAGMHHCELEAVHTLLTQSVAHVYVSQCDLLNLHVARWPCRLVIVATMKPANVQAFQIVFPGKATPPMAVSEAEQGRLSRETSCAEGKLHRATNPMNNPDRFELSKHWEVALDQPVFSSPATVCCTVSDATTCYYVLFATVQAEVCALDASCGVALWKTALSGQIFADLSVAYTHQWNPEQDHVIPARQIQGARCTAACVLVAANTPGHNVVLNVLNGGVVKSVERASEAVTSAAPAVLWRDESASGVGQHLTGGRGKQSDSAVRLAPQQWLVTYGDGVAQIVTADCAKQIDALQSSEGGERECADVAFRCGAESFSGVL